MGRLQFRGEPREVLRLLPKDSHPTITKDGTSPEKLCALKGAFTTVCEPSNPVIRELPLVH